MGNSELVKYYMSQNPNTALMADVGYFDIIRSLNNHFNGNWTWTLEGDTVVEDGTGKNVMTTVMLYTPGHIYTGRSYCKVHDYHENHLHALYNASLQFIDRTKSGQNSAPQNNTQVASSQMTAEQIAAMTGGSSTVPPVNTAADFANYKDNQGRPADSIPFDDISTNASNEQMAEMGMLGNQNTAQGQSQPQTNSKPPQQNNGKGGYTQAQIDAINKFKKDNGIENNDMFDNWVSYWHTGWGKKNLTPQNIDDFLKWAETAGES